MSTYHSYNLCIKEEHFFNNGKIMLKSLGSLEGDIRKALNKRISVQGVTRNSKGGPSYTGISAKDLNNVLRNNMAVIPNINGETHVKNGVFFSVSKEGFDFSLYDKDYNFSRLYNYYVGATGIMNGEQRIIDDLSKKERGGRTKRDWKKLIEARKNALGGYNIDYNIDKSSLTVVGELQFGNWALAYRDIIRLLNANANPGIDFYIYITATGRLHSLLSAQTVFYDQICSIMYENAALIQVPAWIIGLDI